MKIAFVGGGSGGHFYPLIATAEILNQSPLAPELYYFGPTAYDENELKKNHIKHIYCPAGKLRRYFSWLNLWDFLKTIGGLMTAFYKLYFIYPDVIFSKGGYTSVPILLMARFYRIPVVIHESDSKPGRANLLARKFARYIGIAYAEVADYFPVEKTALIGIPVRQAIAKINQDPFTILQIPDDKPLIYVTGGSLGAERINSLILLSLNDLLPHYRIFHQTGPAQEKVVIETAQSLVTDKSLLENYYVRGLLPAETITALLDASTLVISRAGSTTIYEIAMHGKPAIIIPIPEEVSHDQRTNAYAYARTGAASVLEEGNLNSSLLTSEITAIIDDPNKYSTMQTAAKNFGTGEAATKIAEVLLTIGQEHG